MRPRTILAALLAALLAACGGGGGGGDSGGGDTSGIPGQAGCFHQYNLTLAPALSGPDPLIGQQWHLDNTGQSGGVPGEDLRAFGTWSVTRGAGTRVAVVDDAIETIHEDLAPNVVPGESFNYRSAARGSALPLPCEQDDDHGTAVAGIVAARDGNARGVAGVAPRAALVGYNALTTLVDADVADALTRGLVSNDVYNNSWGSPDDGRLNAADATFAAAVDFGVANGRGGKGAIYVFPSGNGGCFAFDGDSRCMSESSGLDGYVNRIGVIAACGVDDRGRRSRHGEPGANLLVCGFTGSDATAAAITTTAPLNRYRSDFRGTSASTPMVSGVVALMLAANPALTWRDVRLILAQTARRNDPTDPGWAGSAFAAPFNHSYGFGVADAQAAVAVARTWASVGASSTLRTCGPYERTPAIALPDAGSALSPREDSIAVGADCTISRIEYVEVAFTADHSYSGDLRIALTSPNGLVSRLVDERVCDGGGDACGPYSDWRFGSMRHLNEPAPGAWTLRVTDAQSGDNGVWQGWSIRFWGR